MDESITHYAVLVGVNRYPEKTLRGCVRDTQEAAKHLSKLPTRVHLETLTATTADDPKSFRPVEDSQVWPTYDNLKSSIKKITSLAKTGDFVYIHYSGHGTRITPSAINNNLGDVALVLLEGENGDKLRYFRGVELAHLINDMVTKGLLVTLILDCCFSGSMSRHDDAENIRSISYDIKVDATYPPEYTISPELEARADIPRDASMLPNWLINPDKYTILAACGPHEVAKEVEYEDNKRQGALSFLLLRTLTKINTSVSTQQDIYNQLHITFRQIFPQQNPVLYGNKNLRFFDSPIKTKSHTAFPVIRNTASSFSLRGGQAHGMSCGDLFAVYPSFSEANGSEETEKKLLIVRVTQTKALTSSVEVVNQSEEQLSLRTGWLAKPIKRVALRQYPIQLSTTIPDQDQWLEVSEKQTSLNILHSDPFDRSFSFQIALDASDTYQILDRSSRIIPNLPLISRAHDQAAGSILAVVEHLSWFKHVKAIVNPTPNDDFVQSFSVKITNRSGEKLDGEQLIEVHHNDIVVLEVQNKGKIPLYVSVFNLSQNWEIEDMINGVHEVIPAENSSSDFSGVYRKKIIMTVPPDVLATGREDCEDVVKVIVTTQPTTFTSLELPSANALAKMDQTTASTPVVEASSGDADDDWTALNFLFHTALSKILDI